MPTTQEVMAEAENRMKKSVQSLSKDMDSIRTGRASAALVESIPVEYYGAPTPLSQVATISVPESRVIAIQPWDKTALAAIEKAIMKSDIGITPRNDGAIIRLTMPPLTQERRKDLVKVVGKKTEESHVAVRNIRRDALEEIRKMEKDKSLSQDDSRRSQEQLQKLTDSYIAKLDKIRHDKEAEVMAV
ncbi:MAG: ribosome recycling factor [SAR202 cluster bacterium]|nr:ribosome recycling factor [SAR202 cluster bacterium]